MARIFVSYRRADLDDDVARLRQVLQTRFGEDNVFFDVQSIRPGEVFADRIQTAIRKCDVVLAVIGRRWVGSPSTAGGGSRLLDADDFVRLEVEAAIKQKVKVIPVLVGGAPLPCRGDLPPTMWALLDREAHEIRAEHLDADVRSLIAQLNSDFRLLPWEP
jgi:hypothetical protein